MGIFRAAFVMLAIYASIGAIWVALATTGEPSGYRYCDTVTDTAYVLTLTGEHEDQVGEHAGWTLTVFQPIMVDTNSAVSVAVYRSDTEGCE